MCRLVRCLTVTTGKQIQCEVVKKFVDIHNLTIISRKNRIIVESD